MRRSLLLALALVLAGVGARLAGYPSVAGGLLGVAVLVWQLPYVRASQAALRSWCGEEPLFPVRPPAEELTDVRTHPDRPALRG